MITMYTLTHLEKNEETGIYKKEKMITIVVTHVTYVQECVEDVFINMQKI